MAAQSKIRNPKTNRMVNRKGKVGRWVLANYYVKSLNSNRLILSDGQTRKKQLKQLKDYIKQQEAQIAQNNQLIQRQMVEIQKYIKDKKLVETQWLVKATSEYTLETKGTGKDIQITTVTGTVNFKVMSIIKPSESDVEDLAKNYYDNERAYTTFKKLVSFSMIKGFGKYNKKTNAKKLHHIKMFGGVMNYNFSEEYDNIRGNNGRCVLDYLMHELSTVQRIGKNKKSQAALMKVLKMNKPTDGADVEGLINFVMGCRPYLNLYVFDPCGDLYKKIRGSESEKSLCFIINNYHLYPILQSSIKKSICVKEKFDLCDYSFNVNYDNHDYVANYLAALKSDKKVILVPSYVDFNKFDMNIQNENFRITTSYQYSNGSISAFENKGKVYCRTFNYNDRIDLLKKLDSKYSPDCGNLFKFNNQSYTMIGQGLFDYKFGNFKSMRSDLTDEQYDIFDTYPIVPYQKQVSENVKKTVLSYTFDVNKSYTDVILNNDCDYNIFTAFDDVQTYDNRDITIGEYYIEGCFEMAEGSKIYMQNGFYPHNFVKYCIDNKYITKADVKYMMIPSYVLKKEQLAEYAKYCINNFKKSDAKMMINHFLGSIGQRWNTTDKAVNTSSREIAVYLVNKYENNGHDVVLDWNDETSLYFIRAKVKSRKLNTSLPVHRSIISGGVMNLDKLYKKVEKRGCTPVCYNVDSVTLHYTVVPTDVIEQCTNNDKNDIDVIADKKVEVQDNDDDEDDDEPIIFTEKKFVSKRDADEQKDIDIMRGCYVEEIEDKTWVADIGKFEREKYKVRGVMLDFLANKMYMIADKKEITKYGRDDVDKLKNKNFLITGPPGSGKSYMLKKMITDDDIVMSFTNKAIAILDVKNKSTLSTRFMMCYNDADVLKRVEKYKTIYIDEYSMTQPKHMIMLYKIFRSGKQLIFFGDSNQCLNIGEKEYDYLQTDMFKRMINYNVVELDYVKGASRFQDKRLLDSIQYFLKHKKLHPMMSTKTMNDDALYYITCLNKCGDHNKTLNNKSIDKILSDNPKTKVTKIKDNRYFIGCPLIGMKKDKINKICVSEIYTITKIDDTLCTMKSETGNKIMIDTPLLRSRFDYAFALTVYKYQGSSINKPFNIMNSDMMDFRQMYTTISRAKNYDDININYTDRIFEFKDVCNTPKCKKSPTIEDIMAEKKANGYVEKIVTEHDVNKNKNKKKKYDFKIEEVKTINYKFKTNNKTARKCIKITGEGYKPKEFSYRTIGMKKCIEKVKQYIKSLTGYAPKMTKDGTIINTSIF